MDEAARAMCYAFRHPGSGQKPLKLKVIQKLLKKKDAKNRPSLAAISQAAANFTAVKKKQGRKLGQRATSKKDDKKIMEAFLKLRPPGHGIDSTALHKALPKKLKKKIGKRIVIRRLAERGYLPEKKRSKYDLGPARQKKRMKFCRNHEGKTGAQWKDHCQGVGDFKEFTWYPVELQPRFRKLRASWTYMNKKERKQPAFQRPKKWFKPADWKKNTEDESVWLDNLHRQATYF